MAEKDGGGAEDPPSGGAQSPPRLRKEEGTGQRRPVPAAWISHPITEEEVDSLRRHFSKVLELPGDRVAAARHNWGKLAVIVRSLGRRVPADWVAWEVGIRGKLRYEVESFPIAEDHLVLRFQSEEDRDKALRGGPWLVAGQLLAMEAWHPDFVPGPEVVKDALVWLRLPKLPLEYWDQESILTIAAEAGTPVALDDFTGHLKKMGFARVKVIINSTEVPEVQIQGQNRVIWQPFLYENLPGFCFRCGRIGHDAVGCQFPSPVPDYGSGRLPMVVETPEALAGGREAARSEEVSGRRAVFGPWLAMARVRLPRPAKSAAVKKSAGAALSARPATTQPGSLESPPDSAGWQKPTKVAHRRSPSRDQQGAGFEGEGDSGGSVFAPLADFHPLEEEPELGMGSLKGPEVVMAEAGSHHLKRPRSPPRSKSDLGLPTEAPEGDVVSHGGDREASLKHSDPDTVSAFGVHSVGRRLPESWRSVLLSASSSSSARSESSSAGRPESSSLKMEATLLAQRPGNRRKGSMGVGAEGPMPARKEAGRGGKWLVGWRSR